MKSWKKNSWRKYPVKHIPEYPNKKELDKVLDKMFYRIFSPTIFFPTFHIQPRSVLTEFKVYSTVTDLAKFLGLSMS